MDNNQQKNEAISLMVKSLGLDEKNLTEEQLNIIYQACNTPMMQDNETIYNMLNDKFPNVQDLVILEDKNNLFSNDGETIDQITDDFQRKINQNFGVNIQKMRDEFLNQNPDSSVKPNKD